MEFVSSDPSVVRSIRQRYLLNTWLRPAARHRPLPLLHDFQPDRVADELADMMGFDVVGQGDDARFLITQEGARLTATTGTSTSIRRSEPTASSTTPSGRCAMPT